MVFPAAEIVNLAKDAGVTTVIDGAHAPGQIPLNLDDLGADMYIGNCHKWMMAPKGAAFFHASAEWAERVRPLVVGWGEHSLGKTSLVIECDWQGTVDISAFLAVKDAIHYRDQNDWSNVSLKCRGILDEYFSVIQQKIGSGSIYGDPALRPPQMACFRLPADSDARSLHNQLFEDHKVDIPVFTNADGIFIRTSVQAYNTAEDLDRLIAALG